MPEFAYQVEVAKKCKRLAADLQAGHIEFADYYEKALLCLKADPYNRTRFYNIKKLSNVPKQTGQFRLRIGRWRFRYDIEDKKVVLYYCGLRREDTYRA